jgi:hypothetical protein
MPAIAKRLPCRRAELVLSPLGDRGGYVVKDPPAGTSVPLLLRSFGLNSPG